MKYIPEVCQKINSFYILHDISLFIKRFFFLFKNFSVIPFFCKIRRKTPREISRGDDILLYSVEATMSAPSVTENAPKPAGTKTLSPLATVSLPPS